MKIIKGIMLEGFWGRVRIKKSFPETISHKKFQTNYSSDIKKHSTRKVQLLFFVIFLQVLSEF